jgi:hypothetical protein
MAGRDAQRAAAACTGRNRLHGMPRMIPRISGGASAAGKQFDRVSVESEPV